MVKKTITLLVLYYFAVLPYQFAGKRIFCQGAGAGRSRVFLAPWSRSRSRSKKNTRSRSRKKICRLPSPGLPSFIKIQDIDFHDWPRYNEIWNIIDIMKIGRSFAYLRKWRTIYILNHREKELYRAIGPLNDLGGNFFIFSMSE